MHNRGYHDFSSKCFCLTVPKKFVRENFGVLENSGYRKFLGRRRGHSYFPLKNFRFTVPKKIVWEPFCVSEQLCYVKHFMYKRAGYHDFLSKFFCLTIPKKLVREPFCVSKKIWLGKIFMDERGISRNSGEIFLSHSGENLYKGTVLCSKSFLVCKKNMNRRMGGIMTFCRKLFVSHCRKTSWGAFQCVRNFGVSKKFNA